MADPQASDVTFIPYVGSEQNSQRNRELLLASAKRHAAIVSHQRKPKKQTSKSARRLTPKDRPRTLPKPGTDAPSAPAEAVPPSTPAKQATPPKTPDGEIQQQRALIQAASRLRRTADWQFGASALACRPINDFDNAAIQYFLRHGPEQWPGANFSGKSWPASRDILPVSEELIRRAVTDPPLLDSLIAHTAFTMINDHPGQNSLTLRGINASQAALRSVRNALQDLDRPQSLTLSYAILHLCMAAVSIGEVHAAYIHLNFLIHHTRDLMPQNGYENRLALQIRGIDLRYALQSETPPMTSAIWTAPAGSARERRQPLLTPMEEQGQALLASPLRRPSRLGLLPPSPALSDTSEQSFYAAIEEGLLSTDMQPSIDLYMEAIAYLSRLFLSGSIADTERVFARSKVFDCLEKLCLDWCRLHQASSTPGTSSSPCTDQGSPAPSDALDQLVILALQAHMVICLGRYSGYTLNVLSRRLRSHLHTSPHPNLSVLVTGGSKSSGDHRPQLQSHLLLWVLLMGMLATADISPDFTWFRDNAVTLVDRLEIKSEEEMVATMTSFGPAGYPLGDDINGTIRDFFVHVAELRDPG